MPELVAIAIALAGGLLIGAGIGYHRRTLTHEHERSKAFRNGWVAGYDKGHAHGLVEAEVLSGARADRIWERIKGQIDHEAREIPDSVRRSY